MRNYIHQCQCLNDELEFGGYEKTLVDVGNGQQAFLYHPNAYDPSQYVPLDTNNAPSQPPAADSTGAVAAAQSSDDDDDGIETERFESLNIDIDIVLKNKREI